MDNLYIIKIGDGNQKLTSEELDRFRELFNTLEWSKGKELLFVTVPFSVETIPASRAVCLSELDGLISDLDIQIEEVL